MNPSWTGGNRNNGSCGKPLDNIAQQKFGNPLTLESDHPIHPEFENFPKLHANHPYPYKLLRAAHLKSAYSIIPIWDNVGDSDSEWETCSDDETCRYDLPASTATKSQSETNSANMVRTMSDVKIEAKGETDATTKKTETKSTRIKTTTVVERRSLLIAPSKTKTTANVRTTGRKIGILKNPEGKSQEYKFIIPEIFNFREEWEQMNGKEYYRHMRRFPPETKLPLQFQRVTNMSGSICIDLA